MGLAEPSTSKGSLLPVMNMLEQSDIRKIGLIRGAPS
jgi:hypothetical protein